MKILEWGIYAVVFCLPLYLVRFEIFGIPTTVLEMMIYVLFIIWLANRVQGLGFRVQVKKEKSLFFAIVLILVGVSLATVFSSDLRTSAGILKGWFIDPLLFFAVVISVIKEEKQIKRVLFSLFLSGVFVLIISLIYLILGKLDSVGRLQAFYNSPNYLAMYLAPALIIGIGYYVFTFLASPSEKIKKLITRKNIILNTFVLLSVVCLLLSIFFTHSYGTWLGVIAAIGFGLFLYLYRFKNRNTAIFVLGLALIIILFLGYFALTQRETSFNARLIIWQKALEIFKAHPFLGIGPGTFGDYFPSYPGWGVPQPHNLYLAFLLQTGIIGFIGFVLLLIYFFRIGFNLLTTHYSLLTTILMSIMVYILVHGLVDTTYWKNDLSVIFWIIVGIMAVSRSKRFLGIR